MTNKTTNKNQDTCEKDIENRIFDNLIQDEQDKNQPGLLPPQALSSTPPPSLDSEEDTSTLLSPWWSEEPPVEQEEESVTENFTSNSNIETIAEEEESATIPIEKDNNPAKDNVLNISILSFGRSSPKESSIQWKERCLLLATTTQAATTSNKETANKDVQKELENIFDKSKECSMICFLKTSQQMLKDQQQEEKKSIFHQFNPFYGSYISVAKTPARCKEHLLNPGDITKKSFTDYYTINLCHSEKYVANALSRTFSPLKHLSEKYIHSWKDGSQQAFFSKFWTSIQKGDAFYLVRDSTKKLIENAYKKPSDKK